MQSRTEKLFLVYIFSFLISLHTALIVYSSSVFLSRNFGEENIWIIYSLGAIFTLLLNFATTKLLKKVKIESVTNTALILSAINMPLLAFSDFPIFVFVNFIIYLILSQYLVTLCNIIVEDLSLNKQTGSIRGRFLAMQNTGYLLAPFFSALMIKYYDFKGLFLFSTLFIFISIYLFKKYIISIPRIIPHELKFLNTLKHVWSNYDLRTVNLANLVQFIFFTGVIVYVPFKLDQVGISFTTYLSVMLPIALTPFLFIPSWLGHLEDEHKDEKLWIIVAFFGQAICLGLIAFMNTGSVLIWTMYLFICRLFAAIAQTSINSYFFKKVYKTDTPTITLFSSSGQFAFLFGSPVMGLLYTLGGVNLIFLSIAFLLVFVIVMVAKMHDTDFYEKHKTHKEIWKRAKKRV